MTILDKPHKVHILTVNGWIPHDYLSCESWKKAIKLRSLNRNLVMVSKEDQAIPDVVGPREVDMEIRTSRRNLNKYGIKVAALDALAHNNVINGYDKDVIFGKMGVKVEKSEKGCQGTVFFVKDMFVESGEMNSDTSLYICPVCRMFNDAENVYKGTCSTCGYHIG